MITFLTLLFAAISAIAAFAGFVYSAKSSRIRLRHDYCLRRAEGEELHSPFLFNDTSLYEYRVELTNTGSKEIDVTSIRFAINGFMPGRLDPKPDELLTIGPAFPYRLTSYSRQTWSINYALLAEYVTARRNGHRVVVKIALGNGKTLTKTNGKVDKVLFNALLSAHKVPPFLMQPQDSLDADS
jgi:hypothetical protein